MLIVAGCLVGGLVAGCDETEAPPDASVDAGVDGGRDAGTEPVPMCTPECGSVETCCEELGGGARCANLRNDPQHCGLCAINCETSHRGDGCSANQCTCGDSSLGCTGNRQSWCCPPRAAGSEAYCADLDRSLADCGACNVACDGRTSSRCTGGRCVCGGERNPCAGTPDSICCTAGPDVGCVDTTSSLVHCGGCNILCSPPETCEGGTCTLGPTPCPGGCEGGDICCGGACCARSRCRDGACGA